MRNQEQPKDSYWYNNRFVLILMFIAVYVVIPTLLLILGNRQWMYSYFIQDNWYNWIVVSYLILSIVLPFAALFYIGRDKRRVEKQKIFEMVFRNQYNANELGTEIKNAIREAIGKTDIKKSIDSIIKGQNNLLNETIENAFSKLASDNDISEALKRFVAESVDNQLYDVIKEELKESFGKEFEKDENQKLLKEIVQKMVKSLKKEEIDPQKYRFAERIVEEICKNNKSGASDICAIKGLVASILNDGQKMGCVLDLPKEKNKISIAITDRNCKQLTLLIDYMKPEILPSVDNGVFELCNGFTIEIEGGKIKSIY